MESEEATTPTPDPETDDPFADVAADPAVSGDAEALPPGVEPGSLGGENPSDAPPPEEVLQDPEELEEPPVEGEPLPPAEEVPADEEPVEEPEPEPAAEADEPDEEPEPEAETPVAETEEAQEAPPEPEPEPEAETPEPEAEEPKKPSGRRRRSSPKKGKDDREYVLLRRTDKGKWEEAFGPDAKGEHLKTGKKDVPTVVVARNGESALRRAYKLLVDDDNPANMTLVATPAPYFRPKTVNGRVHKQTAISIS